MNKLSKQNIISKDLERDNSLKKSLGMFSTGIAVVTTIDDS